MAQCHFMVQPSAILWFKAHSCDLKHILAGNKAYVGRFPPVRHMIAEKRLRVASKRTKRRRERMFQDTYHRRTTSEVRRVPLDKTNPRGASRALLYRMEDT